MAAEEVATVVVAAAVERNHCRAVIRPVVLLPSFAVYLTQKSLFNIKIVSNSLSFVEIISLLKNFELIFVIVFINRFNFSRLSINYFRNKKSRKMYLSFIYYLTLLIDIFQIVTFK